jgi:hypothetical protein
MIALALLGLAAMWVAVLVPEWWRDRGTRGSRKSSSIDAFHRQLDILGRAAPRAVEPAHRLERRRVWSGASGLAAPGLGLGSVSMRGVPRSVDEASQRRRVVLMVLIGMALLTLLLWLATGAATVLVLHLALDVMVIGFGLMVRRQRQLRSERLAKVRYLAPSAPGSERSFEPALVRSVR